MKPLPPLQHAARRLVSCATRKARAEVVRTQTKKPGVAAGLRLKAKSFA
jgi:hypothetical protein